MERVLIVEDSATQASFLKRCLAKELNVAFDFAASFSQAREWVESGAAYVAALLDLGLPDVGPEELVDYFVKRGIPSIIFTAHFSDDLQDRMWAKPIVDYVIKGDAHTIELVADTVKRIQRNSRTKVLVVDDSRVARLLMTNLLKVHQYQVFAAKTAREALELLETNPDMTLAIIDFVMPEMDGCGLLKRIRQKHSRRSLAAIGISAEGNNRLSARFIKYGANDFIKRPFSIDEFYCRVTQNVEMIEYAREIREASITDSLTGLRNRRFFFEAAGNQFARAKRNGEPLCLAMVDIDHFKRVNDVCGHETGDQVLRHIAQLLRGRFRESDIVARLGGEEFCVSLPGMAIEASCQILESVRALIEETPVEIDGKAISVTVSMGVCGERLGSLEAMMKVADARLYAAKNAGRNKVIFE